jgi:4-oxalmesaconate hydratase
MGEHAMIIDCHGHYTTAPQSLTEFRDAQKAALKDPAQTPSRSSLKIADDQIRDRARSSSSSTSSARSSAARPTTATSGGRSCRGRRRKKPPPSRSN